MALNRHLITKPILYFLFFEKLISLFFVLFAPVVCETTVANVYLLHFFGRCHVALLMFH